MRACIGVAVILALACGTAIAQEKIDAKKLVGKWEQVNDKKGLSVTVEYLADGKLKGQVNFQDKEIKVEGTYKVEGNKLIQTTKIMDLEQTRTLTINKLTDEEMEAETEKGVKNNFKRIKEAKKDK